MLSYKAFEPVFVKIVINLILSTPMVFKDIYIKTLPDGMIFQVLLYNCRLQSKV